MDPYVKEAILKILVERDGMSPDEALEMLEEAREAVLNGADPEEILYNDFGLEPDYIFALL